MKSLLKLGRISAAGAFLAAAACAPSLDVTNPNAPDVARALATPDDVKSLAISSINSWYLGSTDVDPYHFFQVTADVNTANFGNFGMRFNNLEPRIPYANTTTGNDRVVAQTPWDNIYSALGAANDVARRPRRTSTSTWRSSPRRPSS
jgi:hypothetical protein